MSERDAANGTYPVTPASDIDGVGAYHFYGPRPPTDIALDCLAVLFHDTRPGGGVYRLVTDGRWLDVWGGEWHGVDSGS